MIIAIIIVVILVSSLTIYFYPHNDTEYYNNGRSITLRYFNNDNTWLIPNHYHVSSYYNSDGRYVYLNTSVEPLAYNISAEDFSCACMPVNMTGSTVNAKYVYVTVTGSDTCVIYGGHYNGTVRKKYTVNQNTARLNYSSNMCFIVKVIGIYSYLNDNYYNYTVKVSAGKLYDIYYIDAQEESAVYGHVDYTGTGNIDRANGEFIMENENNSHMNIVDVHSGSYYYFVHPDTGYRIYSIKNSTLKQIGTIGNKTISSGGSKCYVIYSDDL
ncbi:MAG: hypothetical protein RE471_09260 [Ferroplasma sp.]|uniref:hypothetical protein n=1 Tax=Ferroplasma sp. TaxID=2591003 RepID=UPI002815FB27|nr:hypothetical protein [Ferroplasma sp.]WMT51152.1 MAG: hypothetical protein RE471_09260 [Ferroplasma sp.]